MPTREGASLIETGDVRLLEAQVAGAEILAVAEAMARIGTAEGRLGLARPRLFALEGGCLKKRVWQL